MCRPSAEGGRRCNKHNPYGIQKRNLQAQKQYHVNKLQSTLLTDAQRKRSEEKLARTVSQIEELNQEKAELGRVKSHVMNLTPATEQVLDVLEKDGFSPYIVGGSVRDALMGLDSKDVDIEVYGGSANSIAKALRKIGKVDEVGKSFGVLKIRIGKEDFDVSLPRLDNKVGDGHRGFEVEVNPDLSLEEATARRDFTINALMYSHRLGFIIDKHGGLKDMEGRKLRHVSEAFDEDPLRVLRGVQMASRFGMELHPDTIEKAKTLKSGYNDLAIERVQIEFEKLYEKGKDPVKALQLLKATGWDEHFAGLSEVNDKKLYRQVQKMQHLIDNGTVPKDKRAMFLSATIANKLNDKDRYKFLSDTTVGSQIKNSADKLSVMQPPVKQGKAKLRKWAYDMPRNLTIRDWTVLETAVGDKKKAKEIFDKASKLGILDGPEKDIVLGNDILELKAGQKPGPWVKEALERTRNAQYSGDFKTREEGLAWIKKNI